MLAFNLSQATESGIVGALTFAAIWGLAVLLRLLATQLTTYHPIDQVPPDRSFLLSGIEMRRGVTMVLLVGMLEFYAGGSLRLASVPGVLGFAAAVLVAYKATERLQSGSQP